MSVRMARSRVDLSEGVKLCCSGSRAGTSKKVQNNVRASATCSGGRLFARCAAIWRSPKDPFDAAESVFGGNIIMIHFDCESND